MKINQSILKAMTNNRTETKAIVSNGKSFHEVVAKQERKLHVDELRALFTQVEEQGTRLLKSRNFRDLHRFKQLVKRFMQESVQFGMDLKQTHSWTPEGYSQMLQTVQLVDKQLIELTEELLRGEEASVDLLGKIGEIKGLLINLFA